MLTSQVTSFLDGLTDWPIGGINFLLWVFWGTAVPFFFGMLNHFRYLWLLPLGKKTPLAFPRCWFVGIITKRQVKSWTWKFLLQVGGFFFPQKMALRLVSESLDPGPKNCEVHCVSPVNGKTFATSKSLKKRNVSWTLKKFTKRRKKTSYQETHFLTFDRTHTPGNVSDDTKEMMKLEKGISFQIWSKKVGRIRCEKFQPRTPSNSEVFPWKGYHSRAPRGSRIVFQPKPPRRSASDRVPTGLGPLQCGADQSTKGVICGLSKNGTPIVISWVFYRGETYRLLSFGLYPLWSFAKPKYNATLMLGKLVSTHSRDSFKRWLALFGACLHGFSMDMNSRPRWLQVVVSICWCCIINWISSPLRSGLTIKKWRRKSPPIYNIQLLYVYIYVYIYIQEIILTHHILILCNFPGNKTSTFRRDKKKEVTTFYPKKTKISETSETTLPGKKKNKWVRRVQIDENSIFWNLSEATLTVAQYSWKIDVWNEQHMHFI